MAQLALLSCLVVCQTIFEAVERDSVELIEDALQENDDALGFRGPQGQTPLMLAVHMGSTKAASLLLRVGANPNASDFDGYTPMHGAAFQGRAEMVQLLMDHGGDPWHVHADGNQPMQRACWGQELAHTATVRVFVKAGAPRDQLQKCRRASPNGKTKDVCLQALYPEANVVQTSWRMKEMGEKLASDEEVQQKIRAALDDKLNGEKSEL